MSSVSLIPAFDRRNELIPLYEEYAAMLLETDPVFARSLAQQNYDEAKAACTWKKNTPLRRGRSIWCLWTANWRAASG